jgi:GT2 family glycosyltransferase
MPARRIASLFRRYAAAHLALTLPGQPLWDEGGRIVGQVDRLSLRQGRLIVEGWTTAEAISLCRGASRIERAPSLPRPDVSHAHPAISQPHPGFLVDLPGGPEPAMLGLRLGDTRLLYPLPRPAPARIALARAALLPAFLRDTARAAPALFRWLMTRDAGLRSSIRSHLRLGNPCPPRGLEPLLFLDDSLASLPERARAAERARLAPAALVRHPVTIVLPVFNAFDLLPEVLDRILRHTDLPWHLVVIEDASTDPALRPWLRDWVARQESASRGRITLIEHGENHGFIRSVNAGLAVAARRNEDVVLMNSDAFVPPGWASRLMRPFLAHDRVASVTPLSNDAEILTLPVMCQRTPMRPSEGDALDRVAATFHPDAGLADVPTGVGFCMAIGRDWLRRVPQFDTAFGRGYGEEVDWCCKVRALGGRHLATAGLFVEHRGGTSFGSAEKLRLIARNNAEISRRHPGFDAEVQAFLQADPLLTPRLALGIAFAAGRMRGHLPVYLAHSLGGGAEDYLQARLAGDLLPAGPGAALVLRVGGALRWQIELHLPQGTISGGTDDFAFVQRLLAPIKSRDIVYSCGVGHPDPAELPARLMSLRQGPGDRIEVLVHDYFPVSPSYTLTDADGRHRGLPDPAGEDPAHRAQGAPLARWQRKWGRLIAAADTVTVFSRDSHRLMLGAYPEASRTLRLRPHRLLADIPQCAPRPAGPPVIGVLGNIGQPKGAAVIADLSRRLQRTDARLVLLGNLDPAFSLAPDARIHGRYDRAEIASLAGRYGIDRWFIPSIWPETFSYATHEALATGLPVWCFDLGAQGEAVRAATRAGRPGGTLPLVDGAPDMDMLLAALLAAAPAERAIA